MNEPESDIEYQDTIALLQEEIARLEAELRLRDEVASPSPDARELFVDDTADRRIANLTEDLEKRDETIQLLWEEILRFEEAEQARQAEWEQLHQWVQDVESRLDSREQNDLDLGDQLEAERRQAQALSQSAEAERRAWNAQRHHLEEEIAALRAELARAPQHAILEPMAPGSDPEREPEREALRETQLRLAAAEATAEALRERLHAVEAELDEARQACRRSADEIARLRHEHQAELAAARTQSARTALAKRQTDLAADERILALRQHLREIHEREEQQRKDNHLSARLSRLWRRTALNR